jgi:hypothetical protein
MVVLSEMNESQLERGGQLVALIAKSPMRRLGLGSDRHAPWSGCYGVIAMALANGPTFIGLPTVSVAVATGMTLPGAFPGREAIGGPR